MPALSPSATPGLIESFAAEIEACDEPAFPEKLAALLEAGRAANDPLLPLRVSAALRSRQAGEAADRLLLRVLKDPVCRPQALWELGYSTARRGEPEAALRYFADWMAESGLPAWQRIHVATQHARLGDLPTAQAILNRISLDAPELKTECMAEAQFYKMLTRYPRRAAEAMLQEIRERFIPASASMVEATVLDRLSQGLPYLMLRMGDGEGASIKLSLDDEQEYALLYRQNRRDFLDIWFRNASLVDNPAFERVFDAFNETIGQADCLGAFSAAAVDFAYRTGSRRDVTWVVNTMRKTLEAADDDPDWASRTQVETLTLHHDLLSSGALGRILTAAPHVGLVSCHSGLASALEERFGLKAVEFHKVPGEKSHAATLGGAAVEGVHWPDRFQELSTTFDQGARNGQLFLVAAGLLGKIYGAKLKRSGAVVLDIGAVADLLMGKATRTFPDSLGAHVLVFEQPVEAPVHQAPARVNWRTRLPPRLKKLGRPVWVSGRGLIQGLRSRTRSRRS